MIFSVCRPQYSDKVSKVACNGTPTLLWEFTQHTRNVSLGCLWFDMLKRELGTEVSVSGWKKIFRFGLIQKMYEKHYCYINLLSENQRYSALYPVNIGMVVSNMFVYCMHRQSMSRLQIYFSSLFDHLSTPLKEYL